MPRQPKHSNQSSPVFIARPTGVFRIPRNGDYYRWLQNPGALWHECGDEDQRATEFCKADGKHFEIYTVEVGFEKEPLSKLKPYTKTQRLRKAREVKF